MYESGSVVPYELWDSRDVVFWAAHEGDTLTMTRVLVEHPTLVNAIGSWFLMTPLMRTAHSGEAKAARLLLHRGARLDLVDRYGRTALDLAAARGHGDVVWLLLEWGADTSVRTGCGMNVLMLGADAGSVEAVKAWLWWKGAQDINAKNVNGATALWLACNSGHAAVVKVLLMAGADPGLANACGQTAMWAARRALHAGTMQALESFEHIFRLYRARAIFEFHRALQHNPTTPIPPYLSKRVAEGKELPVLELHPIAESPLHLVAAVAAHVIHRLNDELFEEIAQELFEHEGSDTTIDVRAIRPEEMAAYPAADMYDLMALGHGAEADEAAAHDA